MMARILRVAAILIAIAGVVDPVLTRNAAVLPPLSIVVMDDGALPDRSRDALWADAARLRGALDSTFDVSARSHQFDDEAAACPTGGACILVSDGLVPKHVTNGAAVIGAVRDQSHSSAIAITRIYVPPIADFTAVSRLDVDLETRGPQDNTTVKIFDGSVLVGETKHQWSGSGGATPATTRVSLDWTPIATGPRRLRVVASPGGNDASSDSAAADAGVDVRATSSRVLMYEPEATWTGTFVRRALESDPRFSVSGRARVAPSISVSRGTSGMLTREALDTTGLVVISAPDQLTAAEVDLLERFVRVRGGSLLLLPDRAVTGSIVRLLPPAEAPSRTAAPRDIGPLRASEIVTFDPAAAGVTVIESDKERPAIVTRAIGRGRVIVSGALDAWRYRDPDGRFSQFWASLAADALRAAGPAVKITLGTSALATGQQTTITVESRSMEDTASSSSGRAEIACEGDRRPIRLWPGPRAGTFTGTVEARRSGTCLMTVDMGAQSRPATTAFVVANDVRVPRPPTSALSGAISAHGGIVVSPDDEATLIQRARSQVAAAHQPRETRPMHSPWWVVPFAVCLGGEWALRRRAGLR